MIPTAIGEVGMRIKGILFDLGETLLDFGRLDLPRLFLAGTEAAYAYLRDNGHPLPTFRIYHRRMLSAVHRHLIISRLTRREFNSLHVIADISRKMGQTLSDAEVEELAWLWYEPLSHCATVEPGAQEILAALRADGIKLGAVSNTFVPGQVLDRHLATEGLLESLPVRVYSCDVVYRKPDRRIFRVALEAMKVAPTEAIFVGDSLIADIWGANRMKMISVLKTARGRRSFWVRARHCVRSLAELPELVAHYNNGAS